MTAPRREAARGALGPRREAVLVPVKAFREAKLRLAGTLDPRARAELARRMAEHVLGVARPLPTAVVCDDAEVALWAEMHGARVIWTPARGLNGAVEAGVAELAAIGFERVTVAHGDLPCALDLSAVGTGEGVVLVADRHGQGTNVASIPARCGFRFAYGPGSLERHSKEALRLGLPLSVLDRPDLAFDVDVPDDLVGLPWRP